MLRRGRALAILDLLVVEALVLGVTIFVTDASSPERFVVWAGMLLLPVLTFRLLARRS